MKSLMAASGLLLLAASAAAQTETKWNARAKLLKGGCGDRVIVDVVEKPGTMNLKFSLGGVQTSEANVALAADGSGQTEIVGTAGRSKVEIPAGTGKRPLKSYQVNGQCEWSWN